MRMVGDSEGCILSKSGFVAPSRAPALTGQTAKTAQ